jgi:hypothetical protein
MAEGVTLYTCPAPTHILGIEHQAMCAASWGDYHHIHMVPKEDGGTLRSAKAIYGKPYVFLNDILSHFLDSNADRCIITNSDIELRDPDGHLSKYLDMDGVVVANRQDHNGDYIGQVYPHGYDLFILPRSFVESLPPTLFCIGQTWWDYWLPYRAIKQGVPLHMVTEPILWHHRHEQQHSGEQWRRMTDHFMWLEKYTKAKAPNQVTSEVYQLIKRHAR